METALQLLTKAFDRIDSGDVEGFLALQAADCEWVTPAGVLHGREAVQAYVGAWHEGFPVGKHEIERAYEVGADTICVEGCWYGTHTGTLPTPAGDVPATGRDVQLPFALIVAGDLDAGQARRVAIYHDQLAFMTQLGLVPEPASA
jgi:predicted ester cyclase